MTLALVAALHLVLAGGGACHLVTNTQILILPSCDLSPAAIAELTGDSISWPETTRIAHPARRGARAPRPAVVPPSVAEMQQRLEVSESGRISAVAQRLSAERERDEARRERDVAARALAALRREVAALRASLGGGCSSPVGSGANRLGDGK